MSMERTLGHNRDGRTILQFFSSFPNISSNMEITDKTYVNISIKYIKDSRWGRFGVLADFYAK